MEALYLWVSACSRLSSGVDVATACLRRECPRSAERYHPLRRLGRLTQQGRAPQIAASSRGTHREAQERTQARAALRDAGQRRVHPRGARVRVVAGGEKRAVSGVPLLRRPEKPRNRLGLAWPIGVDRSSRRPPPAVAS